MSIFVIGGSRIHWQSCDKKLTDQGDKPLVVDYLSESPGDAMKGIELHVLEFDHRQKVISLFRNNN